ncbi:adaptin [Hygrophoropsis aurantiaca]|uniref:Adaptin n=1 Tax=Hygrophoropsis aurantiaca TaxID=72124 RepID=A0ACB7ZYJ5_9AGAM|nr:adaptin [Hygrophoropsis aurantiaca]
MSGEVTCYPIVFENTSEPPSIQELRATLEKSSDKDKIDTLWRIIVSMINGNPPYILPSRDKSSKRLLHLYWEVHRYDENGRLKQKVILVVYVPAKLSLQHPDEYICGATPRFLQKISKDAEFLEHLIPICRSYLEHRHSYVRKDARFVVHTIYREHEHLNPGVPELMRTPHSLHSVRCRRLLNG